MAGSLDCPALRVVVATYRAWHDQGRSEAVAERQGGSRMFGRYLKVVLPARFCVLFWLALGSAC
jgi:hypothetical protein